MLATLVIESVGTQEHEFEPDRFWSDSAKLTDPDSAAEGPTTCVRDFQRRGKGVHFVTVAPAAEKS